MTQDNVVKWYVTVMWALAAGFLVFGVMVNPTTYTLRTKFTPLATIELIVGLTSLIFLIVWVLITRIEE